jgi:hypothetical protein
VADGRPADDTPFRLDLVGADGVLTLTGGAPRGFQSGLPGAVLNGIWPAAEQGWGRSVVQRGESPSKSSSRVASSVRRRSNGGGSTAIHRPRIAT